MTRVLVLELLTGGGEIGFYAQRVKVPNFFGIMAHSVAVWCEELGAAVTYRPFTGRQQLPELIDGAWDVVFVSSWTRTAWVAYAIAAALRTRGVVTVLGGPHAHAHPSEAATWFDYVLGFTDRELVARVLGERSRGAGLQLAAPDHPVELPSLRRRAPFVRVALAEARFVRVVPLLASFGCPYGCDFCSDAAVPFRARELDAVVDDVATVAELFPGALAFWHDPTFGVRFEALLDALERGCGGRRVRFGAESTLSLLAPARVERLARAGFVALLPGIESFTGYADKQGTRGRTGMERVRIAAERVSAIVRAVPYVQVNLIAGIGGGSEAGELARAFVAAAPGAWPNVNLATAYGAMSPLARSLAVEGRVLPVPAPLLDQKTCTNVRAPGEDPGAAFREALALVEVASRPDVMLARLRVSGGLGPRVVHLARAYGREQRRRVRWYRRAVRLVDTDEGFRGFFAGDTARVPEVLVALTRERLGSWMRWIPPGLL